MEVDKPGGGEAKWETGAAAGAMDTAEGGFGAWPLPGGSFLPAACSRRHSCRPAHAARLTSCRPVVWHPLPLRRGCRGCVSGSPVGAGEHSR